MFNYDVLSQRLIHFSGEYESHITVLCDQDRFELFKERCQELR